MRTFYELYDVSYESSRPVLASARDNYAVYVLWSKSAQRLYNNYRVSHCGNWPTSKWFHRHFKFTNKEF